MIKKLYIIKLLIVFILLNLKVEGASSDKIELKWRFKEGQSFKMNGVFNAQGSATIPGEMLIPPAQPGVAAPTSHTPLSEQKLIGLLNVDFQWDVSVKKVDSDGKALLQLELKKAFVRTLGNLGKDKMSYEVDLMAVQPSANPNMAPTSLIRPEDAKHLWEVASNGKIISVNGKGIDQSINALEEDFIKQGIKIDRTQMRRLADMFLYFVVSYPKGSVVVGEEWGNKVDLSSLIEKGSKHDEFLIKHFVLIMNQSWKVQGGNGGHLNLREVSREMPKLEVEMDGPESKLSLSILGNEENNVQIVNESGFVKSTDQQVNITGILKAIDKKDATQELKIPFTLKFTSKISLE